MSQKIGSEIRRIAARLEIPFDDAAALRRASLTLHRWAEGECGDSNAYGSWCIERDEKTGKPFRMQYGNDGKTWRVAIPDRETGALRRVAAICTAHGLHFHHQTDPRGVALYVAREPLTDSNYSSFGVAVGGV